MLLGEMGVAASKRDQRPIQVGVIGFGLAGSQFHAPLIDATPGLELQAIVTARDARREHARRVYPQATVYASAEALLNGEVPLDLLVIATPNDSHFEYGMRAINNGIPVIIDKPIAATSKLASELVAAAHEQKVFLSVFQNRRWDGDYLCVRSIVNSGVLGKIHRVVSRFDTWSSPIPTGWRESPDPSMAGGILVDLGSHLVDQAVHLFGEVDSVYAELDQRRHGALVDDDTFMSVRFLNGIRAHLGMSKTVARAPLRFHLVGERGSFVCSGLDGQEEQLRLGLRPGDEGWGIPGSRVHSSLTIDDCEIPSGVPRGRYEDYYRGVVASLRSGAVAPVNPDDAVYTMTLLEAARRSSESRQEVKISTTRQARARAPR